MIPAEVLSLNGLKAFLALVILIAIRQSNRLFFQKHGLSHRIAGAFHLIWLFVGAFSIVTMTSSSSPSQQQISPPTMKLHIFCYDVILGLLGVTATLTAAKDFPHKLVSNTIGQSGTLHRKAIVTQAEMIEHAYYQFLNLWQILYLHSLHICNSKIQKLSFLWIVTSPWMFRHCLPVHSFSNNWKLYQKEKKQQYTNSKLLVNDEDTEVFLYRIKKGK